MDKNKSREEENLSFFNQLLFSAAIICLLSLWWQYNTNAKLMPYSQFLQQLEAGNVQSVSINKQSLEGKLKQVGKGQSDEFTTVRVDGELAGLLSKHGIQFKQEPETGLLKDIMSWVLPLFICMFFWSYMLSRLGGGVASGGLAAKDIGQSKAKVYMEEQVGVTFADVAGIDEAKEELQEVVNFLKSPEHYSRLGGHLPKGILLVGPPGTGKTLLARAVAGESKVPFFSISGSEFVEMFVGVGAARVRDLFAQAQEKAPCIIFIDELDALGRARQIGAMSGSFDEKEQTLNQLLVEMDGFDTKRGVVLLAATNRPEILDQALLRAGRFDRHILVDRPDKKGRWQILNVHLRGIKCGANVDALEIALLTPGFTGADLANLVNEATLLACRRNADSVSKEDFMAAIERAIAGLEKKNRILSEKERRVVAYHEMGHALVSLSIPGSDSVQKISIIPRGIGALGYTMQRPTDDRYLMSKDELENKMVVLMGGRAAEKIVFHEISTGAADDLSKATDIARSMICRYGMSEKLGPVTYNTELNPFGQYRLSGNSWSNGSEVSEETARQIDLAIKEILEEAMQEAEKILRAHRHVLDLGAQKLLKEEHLNQEELQALLPNRFAAKAKYLIRSGESV